MPIKSLESYLFERRLVSASSIEILQNATIGIDVEHYLSRIYTFKKEQYLAGVGGTPSSLKDYVQLDLQVFREFNIKPIFVIPGLAIEAQHNDYPTNELSPQELHRLATWNKLQLKLANPYLYGNLNTDSFRLFTDPLPLRDMINDLVLYFIATGIDYLISPYDASFQLSYLYKVGLVDSIYGSTDILLCNVDKFILGMEFLTKDFRFIERLKVLYELGLLERQFLDLSIMVGCTLQPVTFPNFPPLPKPNHIQPYTQLNYFKLGLEIIFQLNAYNPNSPADLYAYIISLNDPRLLELYYKGHSALKFLPILNKEGSVELYSVEMDKVKRSGKPMAEGSDAHVKVPNNVHDVISQKLPTEVYFYQSIGLLPLLLLEAITQGKLNIRPSPDGGSPDSYKKLITSTFFNNTLECQLNLITQLLARYYQVKKINVSFWFKEGLLEMNNRMMPSAHQRVSNLWVRLADPQKKSFDLVNLLTKLDDSFISSNMIKSEKDRDFVITSNLDIISTALVRTFYILEIIDNKTHKLTSVGLAIHRLLNEEEEDKLTREDVTELTTLLLLIRANALRLDEPIRGFQSVPKSSKDPVNSGEQILPEALRHITLILRVFSLHRFNILAINYQGPISRSLQSFRSHVRFVLSNVSNVLQCCLLDLLARNDAPVRGTYESKAEWYKLVDELPFYKDCNNTLLGIVAEIYLEYSLRQRMIYKERSKEEIISHTQDHLQNSVFQVNNPSFNINVKGINSVTSELLPKDFKNGVQFWRKFVRLATIVNQLDSKLISDEYFEAIKAADDWMQQFVM